MKDYVIFLQNAWSPFYAGARWPRSSWLRALARSKSGKKLSLITDDLNVCDNLTPIVGPEASSIVPPDPAHIVSVISRRKPRVIIGCGLVAERVLTDLWDGSLMILPHPACRWLPDELYLKALNWLNIMLTVADDPNPIRIKIWQRKGAEITVSQLPPPVGSTHVCKIDEGGR